MNRRVLVKPPIDIDPPVHCDFIASVQLSDRVFDSFCIHKVSLCSIRTVISVPIFDNWAKASITLRDLPILSACVADSIDVRFQTIPETPVFKIARSQFLNYVILL
jgi:hypothetical protein